MEWSDRSFLLDIKPNGCFANLFVNCPEGDHRDLIRILKDGVELASHSNNADSDGALEHIIEPKPASAADRHQSLKAAIDGLLLCPDTVTNYAWTDDHQTFSCKLKVERWEECYFSPKNLKATLKILNSDATLDQFCQQLNGQEAIVHCGQCGRRLLKENAKITRTFPLPSSNYGETADEWFCCCSHHREHQLAGSDQNGDSNKQACSHGASSSARFGAPSADQCFIGDSYFTISGTIADGVCASLDNSNRRMPLLKCAGCSCQLGSIEVKRDAIGPMDAESVRFYHSAVTLQKKNVESPRSFLSMRFRTRERYFAWLLLSECEQQSSLKFALKTLDNHPALLVWLLDSYSIMVNGRLSDLWNSTPFKPFPILKLLYKKLDDSDMSDPRVTGEDGSVGRISLPRETCDELMNYLSKSTASLPPACRAVGHFSVGYVRMATSL